MGISLSQNGQKDVSFLFGQELEMNINFSQEGNYEARLVKHVTIDLEPFVFNNNGRQEVVKLKPQQFSFYCSIQEGKLAERAKKNITLTSTGTIELI